MSDGDLCPGCDEEFVNCTCPPKKSFGGPSGFSRDPEPGEHIEDLYDGWYDPGK